MYLDANFFIFANFSKEKQALKAREILKEIEDGRKAVTSVLALDEVMWTLIKMKLKGEIRAIIEEIYSIKNLEIKETPKLTPLRALDFMESYNLRPRDAFHLAVMEEFNIKEIVTDDNDFDEVSWINRIKL